ncbi:MAG TPA: VWA domain-containing protein, partial [Pyrinomonadaceae bacterium]
RVPNLLKQLAILFTAFCASAISATAQQPQNQNPDVIRVNTSLVQTDVMVFDKQGKFVDKLKREQFVLKVDGKPREISFFELVKAGSSNEEAQLAAARGVASNAGAPAPLDRGRLVFFFIDDLHLSEESMHHTRKLLSQFVDREMGQNDQVALIAASGQIRFLQQLTDNKSVLLKAVERVRSRPFKSRDYQSPPMSEFQALRIDQGDRDVLDVFIDEALRENPLLGRARIEEDVRGRASAILRMAALGTTTTLASLQWVMEKFRSAPGRKLLFLLSDGFILDSRNSDSYARLRKVTASAAASAFVIYSIDARGLATGQSDASTPVTFDPSGRMSRGTMGEIGASQDGLHALANDTGGRAFFDSNALFAAVTKGLNEASVYYLLAWRPDPNEDLNPKQRRLELSVIGRPDLNVRSRNSVGETPEAATKKAAPAAGVTTRTAEVSKALQAPFPKSGFPVDVTLNVMNSSQHGDVLITSVSLDPASLHFENKAGVPTGAILLSGLVLNDEGKVLDSFNKRLTVRAKSAQDTVPPNITYTNYLSLKPGLYQVRVAAADEHGGPTGSAWDWIEVSDFSAKKLALSTLFVGERRAQTNTSDSPEAETDPLSAQVNLNVARRFASSSYLRLTTIVYNAASGPGLTTSNSNTLPTGGASSAKPDLAVQIQVFRDGEPVITDPLHRISTEGATDMARIPYAADLNLAGLAPGKYVLQLTVIDRIAKTTASQRVRFQVD